MLSKELQPLLSYEELKKSPILSKFLQFVIEKKLAGSEDEIKEYTIGVKGLGKPSDFNPQLDASVRIHAGRLRKILQDYYLGPGKDDVVFIDIPKGTYVPVIEKREMEKKAEYYLSARQEQSLEKINVSSQELIHKPTLAVLPFHNLSPDYSKEYFVKGIGEQLSTDLARFQNISVISYYSTDKYNIDLHDLQTMKKTVNIDYVLTGSVRFINDLVRLNIQLIQAENGQIIYTDTYSKHLTSENVFEIQEEIAGEILNAIVDDHGIIIMAKAHTSSVKTESLTIQEAVYRYFNYTSDFDNNKFQATTRSLEKAVAAEPENALAGALLASMYMFEYCTKKVHDKELLQKAYELSLFAVGSDPTCQHAQKALAWALLLSDKREKCLEVIETCIKLNPKASSVIALITLAYVCLGQYDKGYKWLLETTHLSPVLHASGKFAYCLYYFHKAEYEESLKWLDRMRPIHAPLFSLIRLSLLGKIDKRKIDLSPDVVTLMNYSQSLVDRMIFDPELKSDIIDGLKLSGLTVK